jgi:UDP-N-acetylmuramoylalanine--D-glutamate ligase
MAEFSVTGTKVVVLGAARSGIAAAELLVRRGAKVTLSESRETIEEEERLRVGGISLELGGHRPDTLANAELIVLSPGVSPRLDLVARQRRRGIPMISEIELASRWLRGRIVAITGTKGKSTTTVLIGQMLDADGRKVLVGGNVGTALSSQVERSSSDVIHVVEVSSFQLELIQNFRPWIAVCLNLSPDHLDRHASFQDYVDAKARIFSNQTSTDEMVINADDPNVLKIARRGRARSTFFSVTSCVDEGISVVGEEIFHRTTTENRPLLPLSAVTLPGRHFLSDVLAASAVGTIVKLSPDSMRRAVENFTGLEHALEYVREVRGIQFINDSKATNIVAARASIECFNKDLVLIIGGRFKGGDFADLAPVLAQRATAVVAIGEARVRLREALSDVVDFKEAETMSEAVRIAAAAASPGGVVLLAPACASLDMFTNYEERGRLFREEVGRLV